MGIIKQINNMKEGDSIERKDITSEPAVGRSWADARKELFTPEEIAESDLRVALMGERVDRHEKDPSQIYAAKEGRQ